jgi:hypothetical protein
MARRLLVVTTASSPQADVEAVVRARHGEDAEVPVVAPASKLSFLSWLTNAEDDARVDAAQRAEAASDAVPAPSEPHVGDTDPLQAIEDALRQFPADEIVVITAPDEEASWLETGVGERARERFALPVTHLVTA